MKQCKKCSNELPIEQFETNGKYTRNICHTCRLVQTQERRAEIKLSEKISITEKLCTNCTTTKNVSSYNKSSLSPDGFYKHCRECVKLLRTKPNHNQSDNRQLLCRVCNTVKDASLFKPTKQSSTGYYKTCSACWKPIEWNKDKQKMSEKKYVEANRDKMQEKWCKAGENVNRRIRDRLNHRIADAMRSQSNRKSNNTVKYIGCDLAYMKKWLEYQFNTDIGWHNYGEWHIDHVIPCSSFNFENEEEQLKCFNWTNLRPCLAKENMEKSNKIIEELIAAHKQTVSNFLQVNPLPTLPGDRVEGTE